MNPSGVKDETREMVATARARSHFTIDSYHIDEIRQDMIEHLGQVKNDDIGNSN